MKEGRKDEMDVKKNEEENEKERERLRDKYKVKRGEREN